MLGGAGCSALDLGQVVGRPAAAGPEGPGIRRSSPSSRVAGVLSSLRLVPLRGI